MTRRAYALSMAVALNAGMVANLQAAEPAVAESPYMGEPVALTTAPNGALANKRLLEGIGKVGWTEPTIEQPADGIWVFGGYGLAPVTVIDTELKDHTLREIARPNNDTLCISCLVDLRKAPV